MREVLEQEFRILHVSPPQGLIETASILTTTNLIAETDMVGVMPKSIAQTYAKHGLLQILPCHIQHKMEAFGTHHTQKSPSEPGHPVFAGGLASLAERLACRAFNLLRQFHPCAFNLLRQFHPSGFQSFNF